VIHESVPPFNLFFLHELLIGGFDETFKILIQLNIANALDCEIMAIGELQLRF